MGRPRGIVPLCLWPGLAQIYTGQWGRGIVLCASATALLNLALIGGWIWTELLPREVLIAVWSSVVALWLGTSAATFWGVRCRKWDNVDSDRGAEHRKALEHYLGRQWADTETCLQRMLGRNPDDCDALLHLATLYRRQGRLNDAAEALRACRRRDAQRKWAWEIGRESQRVVAGGSDV